MHGVQCGSVLLTSSLPDLEVEDDSSSDASLLLRAVAGECRAGLGSSRLEGRPVVSALAVLAAAILQNARMLILCRRICRLVPRLHFSSCFN